jgi:hypothetical protein
MSSHRIARIVGWVASSAMALALAGCSSTPTYRPFDGRVGYSDAMINPAVYQVTFNGPSGMSMGDATRFATLRAAQLTQSMGKRYFEQMVVQRESVTNTTSTLSQMRMDDYIDRKGRLQTSTTYYPGSTVTTQAPVVTLEVKPLDTPTSSSVEAGPIVENAIAVGIIQLEGVDGPGK